MHLHLKHLNLGQMRIGGVTSLEMLVNNYPEVLQSGCGGVTKHSTEHLLYHNPFESISATLEVHLLPFGEMSLALKLN